MTNERASAKGEARPVTDFENDQVKGQTLCAEQVLRAQIDQVTQLRERHANYLASLPVEPGEVIRKARSIVNHGGEAWPAGVEEALHLSHALEMMLKSGRLEAASPEHNATLFVADRVASDLREAVDQLDHFSDVLGNPDRLKRDAENEKLRY